MSANPLRAFGALVGLVAAQTALGALRLVGTALEAAARPAESSAARAPDAQPIPSGTKRGATLPDATEPGVDAPAGLPSRDAVEQALTSMASSGARRERAARQVRGKGPRKVSARRRDAPPPPA